MKTKRRSTGFWTLQVPGWLLLLWLVYAQGISAFSYRLGVAMGTQEPAERITQVGAAFWYGFAFADLVIYLPLLLAGLIGHLRDTNWGRVSLAAALGITVYWPIVSLAALVDARDAPGWEIADEGPYWLVCLLVAAWGAVGLWLLMNQRLAKSREEEDVRLVNCWNRFIYALWSPFYDLFVNARAITRARGRAFALLPLKNGDRVCLVGVGTGADFAFLPQGISAVGIDLSKPMLAKARKKLPIAGREITLECASAESLPYADDSFDAAVLTLLVSVAADGAACLREAVRVTRPDGRLLVFDKFLPPDTSPSFGRRLFNLLTRTFGTNINRSFEPMISGLPVSVLKDEPVMFSGSYRAILLRKDS